MKICTCCKMSKPSTTEFFYKKSGSRSGLCKQCKVCTNRKQKEYHEQNPEINKEATKRYREKNREKIREKYYTKDRHEYTYFNSASRKYGITKEDYQQMWDKQGGFCRICSKILDGQRRPAVDHDHITGKVRGLLCSKCNTGLGQFNDNPDLLLLACDYLLDFSEIDKTISGDY